MRVCLILEGSYPYTHGGVSTWMHNYIKAMPDIEFILWVIGANAKDKGKFVYELPANVSEVHEVFLDDALKIKPEKKRYRFRDDELDNLKKVIDCGRPDWDCIVKIFQEKKVKPGALLMSSEFLNMLEEVCASKYKYSAYSDTFHTVRSMMLPLFYMLSQEVPKADIYHTICTGYGGILGVLGHVVHKKPLILSEHGIYSREREEEIIRANWVVASFKKRWIEFFYMLSDAIYKQADLISSLFNRARATQIELGVPKDKCYVIGNGVNYERFAAIPLKEDDGYVDIGAVMRMAPIKDVKTLIYAFYETSLLLKNVRLYILGAEDDKEYAEECYELVRELKLSEKVIFTGQVDVVEYMKKFDFTVLSSISEGQPLSVLESLAARRPCVTTDVGCCRELLEDESDGYGVVGYIAPPMNRSFYARELIRMCSSREERLDMGNRGQLRVRDGFRHEDMIKNYRSLYTKVEE